MVHKSKKSLNYCYNKLNKRIIVNQEIWQHEVIYNIPADTIPRARPPPHPGTFLLFIKITQDH